MFISVWTRRLCPRVRRKDNKTVSKEDVAENGEEKVVSRCDSMKNDGEPIDDNLVTSIFAGDALHNFADGIFVGTAFLLCSRDVAWTILAATVFHEVVQELADFFLLTVHANLGVVKALVLKIICGLFCTFGALLVIYVNMSQSTIGVITKISAGVYITMIECYPVLKNNAINDFDWLLAFLFFLVGVVPIGTVLLVHEHYD